jgi:NADH-quinone oxidoreductase subunit N
MTEATMPAIEWAMIMPVIIMMLTGCVALIIEMFWPKQNNNLIVGVTLAGLGWTAFNLIGQLGSPAGETLNGLVVRDTMGLVTQLVLVGVTFLTVLFSEPYMRQKKIAFGEFYPLALWSAAGGMIMATSHNLLMIFLGLEVLSIALYCMAGLSRQEHKSEESALKYFLLGAFASAFLLYGIAMFFGATGSLHLSNMPDHFHGEENLLVISIIMMLVGLGFKLALAPFHQWTPDVYQGAPTNVTAFMATASKAAALVAAIRVLSSFAIIEIYWQPLLVAIAVLSMAIGSLSALVQKDVKRVLGYSSIANAGYLVVAFLADYELGDPNFTSAIFYLVVYSIATVGAFAAISIVAKNGKEGTRFEDLYGMWKNSPLAAGALVVFMASLIGIPPAAGFFGKLLIFQSALEAEFTTLAIILAAASVASAFYYLRIMHAAFVENQGPIPTQAAPMKFGLKAALMICIAGTVIFAVTAGKVSQTISGDQPETAISVMNTTGEV